MNYDALMALIRHRQSCRAYDPGKEVSDADILKALEAARLAPSSCNKQPWRFIIVRDKAARERICKEGLLPGISMSWILNAPVIIVLCAEPRPFIHWLAPILSGVQYQLIDLGIAGAHMNLAFEALGLSVCWIGWFKEKMIRKLLGIPAGIQPAALITLGYEKERHEPTSRLEMPRIAFKERWNKPL
ncbi:MAG: Albonoursin synthase [Lentisphaerae bacterium ADurb.Bin242]|nr:MAG: Albonoursin synthase [Lentisphaerae bacterium ADurb.Bin242]